MKNDELQLIWKSNSTEIRQKSKEELNLLLASKAKQSLNRFLILIGISALVSLGLLLFLVITSLHRRNDLIYLVHNTILGSIAIFSLLAALLAWYKLEHRTFALPFKKWLEEDIKILSTGLSKKSINLSLVLIPFINVLTVLSIHVYFENKMYLEVLQTEGAVAGLVVGTITGVLVSLFIFRKIRKYQSANLEFLKDLYRRITISANASKNTTE